MRQPRSAKAKPTKAGPTSKASKAARRAAAAAVLEAASAPAVDDEAAASAAGYSALPVRLRAGSPALRWLFVRRHAERRPAAGAAGWAEAPAAADARSAAAQRSLFVAAVPHALGFAGVRALFGRFGRVAAARSVALASLPAPGALLTFADAAGLRAALAAAAPGAAPQEPPPAVGAQPGLGLGAWVAAHRAARPGAAALRAQLDARAVAAAAAAEAAEAARRAAEEAGGGGGPGDDGEGGWTLVAAGRGGRARTRDAAGTTSVGGVARGRAAARGAVLAAAAAGRRGAGGAGAAPGIYAHSRRDAARDALALLRARFKEDQAKVKALREARAFKPL